MSLTQNQLQKLVKFCDRNFDGHGISFAGALKDLAIEVGLTCKTKTSKSKAKRKPKRIVVLSSSKQPILSVEIHHRDYFVRNVGKESLDGYVKGGDWWGFTSLNVIVDLADTLANFRSKKLGRGSVYHDCMEALWKLVKMDVEGVVSDPKKVLS